MVSMNWRETIFMLTHIPGRRKTFVLSKCFFHLYPSIHQHVKIIKQVMKNIFGIIIFDIIISSS